MTNTAPQKRAYATFCQSLPDCPVFAYPWYLDGVVAPDDWQVVLVEEKGQVIAALPYFRKRRWGFSYVTMPVFTKFMGPLLANDHRTLPEQHRLYRALIGQLPPLAGFDQQFSPAVTNWLPFRWAGYRQTTQYTYQIKLREQPDWQSRINRNMRRNIRKADARLRLRTDLDLATFYEINRQSFARQQLAIPYSFAQLQAHDKALARQQARQLFFAEDEQGRIHSAAYLIWDRERAYYHLSGDDPDLRGSGSGIWLIAQAIQYTQEVLQLPYFDFEGSMLPPVEAIRRQFGAEQLPYFRVWKINNPLYGALKRYSARMPIFT